MPRTTSTKPASEERAVTDKRARTRRIVLRSARDCIVEKGVAGATAAEITRRCNLSWGVIQYHFGDRVGLFVALLETGIESFTREVVDIESAHPRPSDRVRALLDGIWALMQTDEYRMILEIEFHLGRHDVHQARVREYARKTRARFRECWRKALPEYAPSRVDEASGLATAALRGFALERTIEGSRSSKKAEREIVHRSVIAILDRGDE